jgi:hypothetical protein
MTPAKAATTTKRATSIHATRCRRSYRSTITPAGSANNSHGNRVISATSAISVASRVRDDASHTTATLIRPSPRLLHIDAVNSLR